MTEKKVKILDTLIVVLTLVFAGSLTNSIFINQLGYFGALFFILVRYFMTRENQFLKTGLEIPFLLFIAAEIISAVLSENPANAFENVMKRALLIPIVYTIIASARDGGRVKRYFNVYLFFAILSIVVYFIASTPDFIRGVFQISNKQLSFFQYPITLGTLISFTTIYLFAFIINEKRNWQYKLLLIILFGISLVSIFATYKRTGWIGLGAGLAFVVLLKRKWIYIIPGIMVVATVFIVEKNESSLYRYSALKNYMEYEKFDTEGRAYQVSKIDNKIYLADYEGGVSVVSDTAVTEVIGTPKPVKEFHKWGDYYVTALTDTRFEIYRINEGRFEKLNEFASRGFTDDFIFRNNKLYVLDNDYGLTVFNAPTEPIDSVQYKIGKEFYDLTVSDSLLSIRSRSGEVKMYSLVDGLPSEELFSRKYENKIKYTGELFNKILIQSESELAVYDSHYGYLDMEYEAPLPNIVDIVDSNKIICSGGKIFIAKWNNDDLDFTFRKDLGFTPKSVLFTKDNLFATKVKQGRIASIFDPHLRSNFVRLSLWKAGIEMFQDHPLFGLGDIDLNEVYRRYKSPYAKEVHGHLHNNYIHLLAILGLFGFLSAMYILVKIFITNIRIVNYFRGVAFSESLALGTAGTFVAFLTAGLTEWNFGDHEIITMVWFTTGLNYALYFWTKKIRKNSTQ